MEIKVSLNVIKWLRIVLVESVVDDVICAQALCSGICKGNGNKAL